MQVAHSYNEGAHVYKGVRIGVGRASTPVRGRGWLYKWVLTSKHEHGHACKKGVHACRKGRTCLWKRRACVQERACTPVWRACTPTGRHTFLRVGHACLLGGHARLWGRCTHLQGGTHEGGRMHTRMERACTGANEGGEGVHGSIEVYKGLQRAYKW